MNSHDGVKMKPMCLCSISSMALFKLISGPSTATRGKVKFTSVVYSKTNMQYHKALWESSGSQGHLRMLQMNVSGSFLCKDSSVLTQQMKC